MKQVIETESNFFNDLCAWPRHSSSDFALRSHLFESTNFIFIITSFASRTMPLAITHIIMVDVVVDLNV